MRILRPGLYPRAKLWYKRAEQSRLSCVGDLDFGRALESENLDESWSEIMARETTVESAAKTPVGHSDADTIMGYAVLGCLVAGGIGIFKALSMESGLDVLLCLLGSVAAFGMVYHICFQRN